jgi:DNA-binding YbaB/EbfC family protein
MKNLGQMMKQVQDIQSRMQAAQEKLDRIEIEGRSGGGLVTVRLNGKGALIGIAIDPSLLKADEKEIVEDLIVAAHADARAKVQVAVADEMKQVTGGLPLPPGLDLPF